MIRPLAAFDPDVALSIAQAPPSARPALAALFTLDERLGGIVARTREPAIGLMRLLWWRDALDGLATAPAPAEPLLAAIAAAGLDGPALAAMTVGWEALIDDPDLADATVAIHAAERGGRLFAIAAAVLGADGDDRVRAAGEGWARIDLARHLGRPGRAEAIRRAAHPALDAAMARRWPRRLRPLGALAALALADCDARLGPRRRVLRVLRHRLTGL